MQSITKTLKIFVVVHRADQLYSKIKNQINF